MNNLLSSTLELTKNKSFVSIREVQMNNGKMQGIYITQEMLDDYMEDIKAIISPKYIKLVKEARKEKTHIPADKVWKELGI